MNLAARLRLATRESENGGETALRDSLATGQGDDFAR
jgi:hypothetical protein